MAKASSVPPPLPPPLQQKKINRRNLRHKICSGMNLLISQVQGISVFRCAAAGKTILRNIAGKSHTATFIGCINLAG
jgi:hypothetical protein